jgi:hypothetical protein
MEQFPPPVTSRKVFDASKKYQITKTKLSNRGGKKKRRRFIGKRTAEEEFIQKKDPSISSKAAPSAIPTLDG